MADGTVPALAWEDSLAEKPRGKVTTFARHVAANEGRDSGGIFEKCHAYPDIWEIRTKIGKELFREFCTRDGDRLVLLSGIVKAINEPTPPAAFSEANAKLSEYKKTRKVFLPPPAVQQDEEKDELL